MQIRATVGMVAPVLSYLLLLFGLPALFTPAVRTSAPESLFGAEVQVEVRVSGMDGIGDSAELNVTILGVPARSTTRRMLRATSASE